MGEVVKFPGHGRIPAKEVSSEEYTVTLEDLTFAVNENERLHLAKENATEIKFTNLENLKNETFIQEMNVHRNRVRSETLQKLCELLTLTTDDNWQTHAEMFTGYAIEFTYRLHRIAEYVKSRQEFSEDSDS